jgi:hypothetical protein
MRSSVKTSIFLDNEGSTSSWESHATRFDVTVHCNEHGMGLWSLEFRDDVAPRIRSMNQECRAYRFVPLLRTMKATEMAN